jgi:hypothetical protein
MSNPVADDAMQSALDVQSNFLDMFHSTTVDTFPIVQWSFDVLKPQPLPYS